MKRRTPAVDFSHAEPSPELLRFASRSSSPSWTAPDFAAWLRGRAAWRDVHEEPLPGLPARERVALNQLDLPPALVEAEHSSPKKPPQANPWRHSKREEHSHG